MRILIFDTETTGKIQKMNKYHKPSVFESEFWPRIVEIAWKLVDDTEVMEKSSCLIKPENYVIPEDSIKIHKITQEMAIAEGIAIDTALSSFIEAVDAADIIVAHNIEFDLKVICSELVRLRRLSDVQTLQSKRNICTMLVGTSFCAIPNSYGSYKWPSLSELYRTLHGTEMGEAHRALLDVEATAACLFKLEEHKRVKLRE